MSKELPQAYLASLRDHFDAEVVDRVLAGLNATPSVSLRWNRRKMTSSPFDASERVPWCESGILLDERPNFALDPRFHAGGYYVQDSSSMILEAILKKIQAPKGGVYLDACAAPGGKSTILLDHMEGQGFLVANEVDPKRNSVLRENLLKWGHLNHGVTGLSTDKIRESSAQFDVIVVDAPCSGEGMFRKDDFAIDQWGESLVESCAATQRVIVDDLTANLRSGGYLIYSTCTMNPQENENQVIRLIQSGDVELALPDLTEWEDWLVPAKVESRIVGYYLLPGISTGEGLFISVLRKITETETSGKSKTPPLDKWTNDFDEVWGSDWDTEKLSAWTWKDEIHAVANGNLAPGLFYKRLGLPFFQRKGKHLIPLHGMAMCEHSAPTLSLTKEDALRFLRKESISLRLETSKGWHLVSFEGVSLGWLKAIGHRTNNYYPSGFRLRI